MIPEPTTQSDGTRRWNFSCNWSATFYLPKDNAVKFQKMYDDRRQRRIIFERVVPCDHPDGDDTCCHTFVLNSKGEIHEINNCCDTTFIIPTDMMMFISACLPEIGGWGWVNRWNSEKD
jgi:hypothetical protein